MQKRFKKKKTKNIALVTAILSIVPHNYHIQFNFDGDQVSGISN